MNTDFPSPLSDHCSDPAGELRDRDDAPGVVMNNRNFYRGHLAAFRLHDITRSAPSPHLPRGMRYSCRTETLFVIDTRYALRQIDVQNFLALNEGRVRVVT